MLQHTKKIIKQKYGVELTLTTIIQFIMAVVVFIVVLLFFIEHFSTNTGNMNYITTAGIEGAKNLENN